VLIASITVREPDLALMPLLDHLSVRALGRSFARLDPAMQYQVARDDAGRPPALGAAHPYQSTASPPGLGMRFGPNGRIVDWRRIRVHSAGRYGHEAPVGRLDAQERDRARAILSLKHKQEETWHA
jgi:hypothetical protein